VVSTNGQRIEIRRCPIWLCRRRVDHQRPGIPVRVVTKHVLVGESDATQSAPDVEGEEKIVRGRDHAHRIDVHPRRHTRSRGVENQIEKLIEYVCIAKDVAGEFDRRVEGEPGSKGEGIDCEGVDRGPVRKPGARPFERDRVRDAVPKHDVSGPSRHSARKLERMGQGEVLIRGTEGRVAVDLGAVGQWPEVDDCGHQNLDVLDSVPGADHGPRLVDVDIGRSDHRELGRTRVGEDDHPHEDTQRPNSRSAKSAMSRHKPDCTTCRSMRSIEYRVVGAHARDMRRVVLWGLGFRTAIRLDVRVWALCRTPAGARAVEALWPASMMGVVHESRRSSGAVEMVFVVFWA